MRCVKVTSEVDAYSIIHMIEDKCDIEQVYGLGSVKKADIYETFLDDCTIYKFMSDDYKHVYATAIIEDYDDGGLIHFAMFKPCHIMRGWKLLMDQIKDQYKFLASYIEEDRQDIHKLLVMLGFKINYKNGYYYGRCKKGFF